MENLHTDLTRLMTKLAAWIPSLTSLARPLPEPPAIGSVSNTASNARGPAIQGRDITTGDVGTVNKNNYGITHMGKGDIYRDSQHFSGNGATYVAGDNHGDIGHRFGDSHEDGEAER